MEINAKIYAVADSEELLRDVGKILSVKTYDDTVVIEALEPCTALPVSKTWYGFSQRAEPTDDPEDWLEALTECARILRKSGAVVVEFRSPDDPDEYLEYAYTTVGGNAGYGPRYSLIAYRRALGNDDISLTITELLAGRTARDRFLISQRRERKETARQKKGDFEITSDGVLKKYRGHDKDVVIPDGVREIGDDAFVDMKGVERMIMEDEDYEAPEMVTVAIPDSVEKIGSYAFAYCLNLEKVEMKDSVKFIGDRAFEGCESLKNIRLSDSITDIAENTFFLCENLRTVHLPEGLISIGPSAFLSCGNLKKVTLPESLKSIGEEAFKGTDLKKISIPQGVSEVGKDAFPPETILWTIQSREVWNMIQ